MEDFCNTDTQSILALIKMVINLIKYAIPLILIIMGTLDLAKIVTNGEADDKFVKAAQKAFVTRIIYAVVIFLIPTIVTLLFSLIPVYNISNIMECFKTAELGNLL